MLNSNVALLKTLASQKGMASIEVIPVLLVFVIFFNFTLGFFGVIHSGILNSIGARNYAFETFRNRSNLNYLRDIGLDSDSYDLTYVLNGNRFHGIKSEASGSYSKEEWPVTSRPIRFTDVRSEVQDAKGEASIIHQSVRNIASGQKVSEVSSIDEGVNPVWIRTLYGICINVKCGD